MKQRDDGRSDFEIRVDEDWVFLRTEPGLVITASTIIAMLEALYSLEAYRSEKRAGLWDFRHCSSDIHYDDMQRIKNFIKSAYDPSWSHELTALVADTELSYGLARMYENMTDEIPTELNVFREIEEAEKWLRSRLEEPPAATR